MGDDATLSTITTAQPRIYRVIVNRAVVLDAIYHDDLRPDSILGYLSFGQEFGGVPFDAQINLDITAHAVQIVYPLDQPPHSGVLAYVLRSHVREVTT